MESVVSNALWQDELLSTFKEAWTPPDNRPIHEWAADHVIGNVYAIKGQFSVDRSRYLIEPFNALKDLKIRQVNIMASPRTFKTGLAEIFLLHTIANNSGDFLWIQSAGEMTDKVSDVRIIPLIKSCKEVKDLVNDSRFSLTKNRFKFPHCTIHLSSAKITALQSLGYKFAVGDEVWIWDKGFIQELQARLGDYKSTSKLLLLSQGGEQGDDWQIEFDNASVYEWGWKCPSCNHEQLYNITSKRDDSTRYGLIWDKNNVTCPDGVWNYQEAGKTARLQCFKCKHEVSDNPQNRRYLNDKGVYICTKSNGDITKKSFRWNCFVDPELPFASIVTEYLQAVHILRKEGNILPLAKFDQKRMAVPHKQYQPIAMSRILVESYDVKESWGDYTFMTVDCQNNFTQFYYVIRRWNKAGESRLIKWSTSATWADLRAVQLPHQIKDQCVLVDSGNMATQVYAKCIEYGHQGLFKGKKQWFSWIALQGYDAKDFVHPDGTRKLYSTETKGDPNLGKNTSKGRTCPHYRWSNYSIKNILVHLRDGKGLKWVSPAEDEEYTRQLNSEYLEQEIDKKTNKPRWIWKQRKGIPNHLWDCECMQLVAACQVNILGNVNVK